MSWRDHAGCRGADRELFYPNPGEKGKADQAREICRSCRVRQECLEWAYSVNDQYGILGGFTAGQRNHLRQAS